MKNFDEKKIIKESKTSSFRRNMEEERKSECDNEIGKSIFFSFFFVLYCFVFVFVDAFILFYFVFNLIFRSFFSFQYCRLHFLHFLTCVMFYIVYNSLNLSFSASRVHSIYISFVYGFFLQNFILQCHPMIWQSPKAV